jgi:hypothetical protein
MSVVTANGEPLVSVELHVPHRGAWWARIEFVDAPELEGSVELAIDELRLVGTIVSDHDGTHCGHRRALVFAGAAGWGTEVEPQHYRADTGVRAALVAEDAARTAGETLGTFEPASERLGSHYVRQGGLARRVLEDAIGEVLWWVDYDGVTHVAAERPEVEAEADDYRVLDYDPLERVATLEISDPRTVIVGSQLTEGLDVPQVVRELDLKASPRGLRMQVWTGAGRYGLADSQAYAVHRRYAEARLWGSWRYRVTRMNGHVVGGGELGVLVYDSLDARPVLSAHGLPELVHVELSPGVPGCSVELPEGLEILVEFVEGNRALPRVVAFAGPDQSTWVPTRLTLDADVIELGDGAVNEVALHNLVEAQLTTLKNAISGAACTPGDGGAAFKAAIVAALATWPGSTAAAKVKAK